MSVPTTVKDPLGSWMGYITVVSSAVLSHVTLFPVPAVPVLSLSMFSSLAQSASLSLSTQVCAALASCSIIRDNEGWLRAWQDSREPAKS